MWFTRYCWKIQTIIESIAASGYIPDYSGTEVSKELEIKIIDKYQP